MDVARRRTDDDGPDDRTVAEPRFVLLAVISSFVLAELGDKTMLATVALASDHHWAGVWIGATAGMVLADGVAIAVGPTAAPAAAGTLPARHGQPAVPAVRAVDSVRRWAGLAPARHRRHRDRCRRRRRHRCQPVVARTGGGSRPSDIT